jgi:flagellar hook-length control protein FliK
MPTIDFNQLSALPITELMFPDPSGPAARSDSDKLFDDYLNRANAGAMPPAADDKFANRKDADRSPPPKSDAVPRPAEHSEAAQPTSGGREGEPSNAATARTEEGRSSTEAVARSKENEGREEPTGEKEAKQDEPKDGKVRSSEESVVEGKKNTNQDKSGSEPGAQTAAADGMLPIGLPANTNVPPANDSVEKKAAGEESAAESKPIQNIAAVEMQSEDSVSGQAVHAEGEADPLSAASKNGARALGEKIEAAKSSTAENPAEAILEKAGSGKGKTKKLREAASDAKNAQRKEKIAEASPDGARAKESAETQSAPAVKEAGNAAKADTAIPPASDNALHAALDVLKAAEKPVSTKVSDNAAAEVRVNSAAALDRAATGREGGAAAAPAGSDPATQALRSQFVQRVERAFAAMGNREGNVRLKLSPPELGVLKIEIGVRKGVMKARIEAETPAAKSLLLDNLPELRERLAQQNIHVQQFDVELMDHSSGGTPQQTFDQNDSGSQGGHRPATRESISETAAGPAVAASAIQRPGMGGSLNVIV